MAKAKTVKRTTKTIAEPPVVVPPPAPEPPVMASAPEPTPDPPKPRIPHPDEDVVLMPKYVPTYSPYGDQGEYAADHRLDRDLFVMINGSRYEHVSDTPDGRWVYRKA